MPRLTMDHSQKQQESSMTSRAISEPSVHANGHLRAWLKERELRPWPTIDDEAAPSQELWKAYSASLEAEGLPPMGEMTFYLALTEARYQREKRIGSNVYTNLSIRTRRERAESAITTRLSLPYRKELFAAEQAAHLARVPHVETVKERRSSKEVGQWASPYSVEFEKAVPCNHPMPESVVEAIAVQVAEHVAELRASGVVDAEVETWYGPFLNGHAAPMARYEADRALDQLDSLIPDLVAMREKRRPLLMQAIASRDEFLRRAPTEKRGPNGAFLDRAMDRLHIDWFDGMRSLDRIDADIERVTKEAEKVQQQLRDAVAILDRIDPATGILAPAPTTTEAPAPVW